MRRALVPVLASVAMIWVAPAFCAPWPTVYAPPALPAVAAPDAGRRAERQLLRLAAASARFQEAASTQALVRATSPAVRAQATVVLHRQRASQAELRTMLNGRQMALPMLSNPQGKVLRRLARLQGKRFERLYVEEVLRRAARADVAVLERLETQAQDPAVRAWAGAQLPALRTQLAQLNPRA